MGDTHNLSGDFRGSTINIKSTIADSGLPPHPAIDPAEAARRLAELPTAGPIPAVAPLPPGSRLPYSPNPLFVGREDDLRRLAAALKGGQTTAIGPAIAATGLGGLGKSQLAVEFAHRYGCYFAGGVFWLSLAEAANVPVEIAACGGPAGLNLPNFEACDLPTQAQLVQAAWRAEIPRLLIFDNCEAEALLAHYRPPSGGCRILITSRRAEWDPSLGVQSHPLKVLARAQSVELLRQLTADHRPKTAAESPIPQGHNVSNLQSLNEIAAELGDLPLALHLAGSFLRQYRHEVTPEAYLAELRAGTLLEHDSLQGLDLSVSPTQHDLHVARTFALSYNKLLPPTPEQDPSTSPSALALASTSASALALLARAAHFAPGEPIPRELLLKTIDRPDAATQRQAQRALRRLTDVGLLDSESDDGSLTLHRLLARFVQDMSADAEAQPAVEEAVFAEAARLNRAGYPAPLLAWPGQSHRLCKLKEQTRVWCKREGQS